MGIPDSVSQLNRQKNTSFCISVQKLVFFFYPISSLRQQHEPRSTRVVETSSLRKGISGFWIMCNRRFTAVRPMNCFGTWIVESCGVTARQPGMSSNPMMATSLPVKEPTGVREKRAPRRDFSLSLIPAKYYLTRSDCRKARGTAYLKHRQMQVMVFGCRDPEEGRRKRAPAAGGAAQGTRRSIPADCRRQLRSLPQRAG